MENLKLVLANLKHSIRSSARPYYIPEVWNSVGYNRFSRNDDRKGEIEINPYDFMAFCIESYIIPRADVKSDALKSLGTSYGSSAADLSRSAIYSMFPRAFTAWDHYQDRKLYGGTFLKAICHLPYLKSLGIDIIYLLPIFEYSNRYKKGEIGSPYAIKNIYKLDPNLHDTLLGEYSADLLEVQFKAFVEACHVLGIKVMVDFVFRTVSRDNDLIIEHPEWFYWIGMEHNETFSAPMVKKARELSQLNDKILTWLYKEEGTREYLGKFTFCPRDINPEKWSQVISRQKTSGENILDIIEKEYGITTAPGFSDMINDPQPQWSDATYLRFYFDNHKKAESYVSHKQPPYIMQDGIKLNLYSGEKINKELWQYISGVIPYYQQRFGIDGARIDMGHALPNELNKEMVQKVKAYNENFILWSEEFNTEKSAAAKADGFHFISGTIWGIYKELEKPGFNKRLLLDTLMNSVIPVTAAVETPDTPRAAVYHKDRKRLEQVIMINCFIPNAVPFINNGQEVLEVQPMNLGLDNTEEGRFVLEKDDPMYGKLAFFDNYRIHWTNNEYLWMQKLLSRAFGVRKHFADLIGEKDNFIRDHQLMKNKKLLFIGYYDKKLRKGAFLIANRSFKSRARVKFNSVMSGELSKQGCSASIVKNIELNHKEKWTPGKYIVLNPGEVAIGSFE